MQEETLAHQKRVDEVGLEEWLFEELLIAYNQAKLGKRATEDEQLFESALAENIYDLVQDILDRTFVPGRGIAFIVFVPVQREIFAAPFRDRVIHHFLYNMVNPWWDKRLSYDSYSCRKGKGTLFGVKRMQKHIQRVTEMGSKDAWVAKFDIQGYFMSLPRAGLYERICWGLDLQFPSRGPIYYILKFLWKEVIFDDPTKGVRIRGHASDWEGLPDNKSLFKQPPGKGIVIGNLSSQLLSNIYLDPLDRFLRFELGFKASGRYVDDFCIVVPEDEKQRLLFAVPLIEGFLMKTGLTLHPNKRYIQRASQGLPFLGTKIYHNRLIPGERNLKNFLRAAYEYEMGLTDETSIIAYLGLMKHLDSTKAISKIFERVGWEYRY